MSDGARAPASSPWVYVRSVGLLGPGLTDWTSSRQWLVDPARWIAAPTQVPASMRLPPAERRRAGDIVKLSLAVAEQARQATDLDPAQLATVFSASTGDAKNCHNLCEALALPDRLVSPTRFTNSVHNASAGYWHIACGSQAPSTSLCAFDGSFSAGLLEAVTQCISEQRAVMLVTADVPYPEPLHGVRPISETMAVALVIDALPSPNDLAALRMRLSREPATPCGDARLDALRQAVPAGRALPLLQALASASASMPRSMPSAPAPGAVVRVVVDYLDTMTLAIEVDPAASSDPSLAVEATQ